MKNSQLAVLCGAVLAGSLIVAATNVWLVHSFRGAGRPACAAGRAVRRQPAHRPVIAVMPKAKGDPYFVSCRVGAEEAAKELGVDLIWDGPTGLDAAKQNEVIESWITRRVDAIAVSVENAAGISTVLAQSPPTRHPRGHLGRRRRTRRARFLHQPGHARRHRQYAHR